MQSFPHWVSASASTSGNRSYGGVFVQGCTVCSRHASANPISRLALTEVTARLLVQVMVGRKIDVQRRGTCRTKLGDFFDMSTGFADRNLCNGDITTVIRIEL